MFRSVSNIVMAPASTGKDSRSKAAVIKTDHENKVAWVKLEDVTCIFRKVDIKLIAAMMEEAPARCKEKIARSTDGPLWAMLLERGG